MTVAEFLSTEWIAALNEVVSNDPKLREASAGVQLVLQQRVTDLSGPGIAWHVLIDDGDARVVAGEAESPDVTFTQDRDTAVAVGTAQLSAQAAFMLGKLRVGGEVTKLIENRAVFDGLDDLFIGVRASTTY